MGGPADDEYRPVRVDDGERHPKVQMPEFVPPGSDVDP
jgi:hypothetical protein